MNFKSWLEVEMQGVQAKDSPKADIAKDKKNSNVKGTKLPPPPSPMSPLGLGVPLAQPKPGFSGGGKWKLPDFSPMSPGTKYKPPDYSPFSANNKWKLRSPGVFGK